MHFRLSEPHIPFCETVGFRGTQFEKHCCKLFDTLFALLHVLVYVNPYPTAFPYGNGMVLHFYQQQESSTIKTVHKVINKGLKTYV